MAAATNYSIGGILVHGKHITDFLMKPEVFLGKTEEKPEAVLPWKKMRQFFHIVDEAPWGQLRTEVFDTWDMGKFSQVNHIEMNRNEIESQKVYGLSQISSVQLSPLPFGKQQQLKVSTTFFLLMPNLSH